MSRYLIVDAHSVIFGWPELRALHQRRNVLARDALVKLLTAYQDYSGVRVVAVFDGQGVKPDQAGQPGGIQIFYSAQGQTADEIIERLAAKYAREHDITVATADHLVQQTTSSFGADDVSVEMLRQMLETAESDLQRDLKRQQR